MEITGTVNYSAVSIILLIQKERERERLEYAEP